MLTSAAISARPANSRSYGPWLWGPRRDLSLFLGSALLALVLVAVGRLTGLEEKGFPEWGWLLFVLGIDVAHVYATLFRTYLDPEELKCHPLRYGLVPVGVFLLGYVLYAESALTFWRFFAYAAVYHFIRQQAGWVALYRAKSGARGALDRWLDQAAIYSATLYPVVHWHAHLEGTRFAWFVQGDFVDWGGFAKAVLPLFEVVWWLALGAFLARQLALLATRQLFPVGKVSVVASTVAIWYVGIVATNSDFAFTVTNVIVHGVPYFALLWAYTRARQHERGAGLIREVARRGLWFFLLFLVCLAFAEELLWDHLVFHDRPWLFGASGFDASSSLVGIFVPLLMVPQATHYVLDGLLWRRKDTRRLPAQRRALGFSVSAREDSQ